MGGRGGWTVRHYRPFIGLTRSRWEVKGENQSRQGVDSKRSCIAPLTSGVTLFKAIDIGVPGGVQGNDMRHRFPAVPGDPPQQPIWNVFLSQAPGSRLDPE